MERNAIAVLFFLVSLLCASCSKVDALFNNGEPVTEQRSVGQCFSVVTMYNNVNVNLVRDSHPHLELTCPKNLIGKISTQVVNDTLIVKNENEYNWLRSYDYDINLNVHYDSLQSVCYASIAKLTCNEPIVGVHKADTTITQQDENEEDMEEDAAPTTFTLRITEGSGDIDLSFNCQVVKAVFRNGTSKVTLDGNVGYAEHYLDSYGTIHAEEMACNIVKVQSTSTNDVYVNVRSTLFATLRNIGNVYYKGYPWVEQNCTSEGRAIRME